MKRDFPNLNWQTFVENSDETIEYNCIAYALGDTSRRWWPNSEGAYWPSVEEGVPQEESVHAFVAACGTVGYLNCDGGDLEVGFEKIALYVDPTTGKPKHAAHQLPDGRWESKLGRGIDILHDTLEELNGPVYGSVGWFLKRSIVVTELDESKE